MIKKQIIVKRNKVIGAKTYGHAQETNKIVTRENIKFKKWKFKMNMKMRKMNNLLEENIYSHL